MSDRIEHFEATIPAGTPKSAPVSFPMIFQQGYVTEIDIKIPSGPSGFMGFFIGAGGSQYIPRTPGSFIIDNDKDIAWPIHNAINSGSWSITGYNTDLFAHTVYVTFHVNEIEPYGRAFDRGIGASSAMIPHDALS